MNEKLKECIFTAAVVTAVCVGAPALTAVIGGTFVKYENSVNNRELEVIHKGYRPSTSDSNLSVDYHYFPTYNGGIMPVAGYSIKDETEPEEWVVIVQFKTDKSETETRKISVSKEYFETLKMGDKITFDKATMKVLNDPFFKRTYEKEF